MEALVLSTSQKTAIVQTIQVPILASNEILVKVHAVALNPVDALYTAHPLGSDGRVVGSDFSGIVTAVGSAVPTEIRREQRVAGFLQGACSVNERSGAFAQYLSVPWDLVWRVPEWMALTDAATISLCSLTAAQALFLRLGLPAPFSVDGVEKDQLESASSSSGRRTSYEDKHLKVLIYGSSTSVGMYAAQLLHRCCEAAQISVSLYGVASRSQHGTLTKAPYCYSGLVDYHDQDWIMQLRNLAGGNAIDLAFDCISEGPSVALVGSILLMDGKLAVVRSKEGNAWSLEEGTIAAEPLYGAVWEGLGEDVEYQGFMIPASPEARRFTVEFYGYLTKMPLRPNPSRVMPGTLERIVDDGFALLGSGTMIQRARERKEDWMKSIQGEKLVYSLLDEN
jgi:NADPH:quinone reductase-like Zn-dependent oxidoreductase